MRFDSYVLDNLYACGDSQYKSCLIFKLSLTIIYLLILAFKYCKKSEKRSFFDFYAATFFKNDFFFMKLLSDVPYSISLRMAHLLRAFSSSLINSQRGTL